LPETPVSKVIMEQARRHPDVFTGQEAGNRPLEWWTPRQLAARWQVSTDTVIRELVAGNLVGRKIGGRWRVHTSAVDDYERAAKPRHAAAPVRPAVLIDGGDPWGLYASRTLSTGRSR
jgi:hypothetical protein